MDVRFYQLAIGARFTFHGREFVKTAMCAAEDERRWGSIFMGEAPVSSDGPLLPPDLAAAWKPDRGHWSALIESMVDYPPPLQKGGSDQAPP
jgi:hypothetical protein